MKHRTQEDLQRTVIEVRTCEAQVAARRGFLDAMRVCGQATDEMERSIVIKQVELELLKVIEEEIADQLSGWGSSSVISGTAVPRVLH